MFTYLCRFLYTDDTSSHSANIPDQIGYMILVESDSSELESLPKYKFTQNYIIQEYLEQNDCEDVSIELLSDDDIKAYSDIKEKIVLKLKDLD